MLALKMKLKLLVVAWVVLACTGYEVNLSEGIWDFKGFKNEVEFLDYLKNNHSNKTFDSGFSVTQSNFNEVPTGLFSLVRSSSVKISGVGLKVLKPSSFENATVVESLDFSDNDIKDLPSRLFVGVPELRYLDFHNNKIETIQEGALEGCKLLNILNLASNNLTTIPTSEFKFLTSIKSVDLSSNQIKKYEKLSWSPHDSEELNLRGNEMTELVFEISGRKDSKIDLFRKLDVSYNKLESISIQQNLEYLDASNNKITRITIGDNVTIEHLNLAANNLTVDFLEAMRGLDTLKTLDLSGNILENLSGTSFTGFQNLQKLILKDTGLSKLFPLNLKNLEVLDLSENVLNEFDYEPLRLLTNLKSLIITGNQIQRIDNFETISRFSSLKSISLMNNDWKCAFLKSFFKKAEKANITIEQEKPLLLETNNYQGYACVEDLDNRNSPTIQSLKADEASNKKLELLLTKLENFTRLHENSLELQESKKSETLFIIAALIMILYFLLQVLFFIKDRISNQGMRMRENYKSVMMPLFEDSV